MLGDIDNYFLQKEEPAKSCLLFLRKHILAYDADITEARKYRLPFTATKAKCFVICGRTKSTGQLYIGFVDGKLIQHPGLLAEKRSRMKVLM